MEEKNTESQPLPVYRKYGLTVSEAAAFFGIGEKAIRRIIADHPEADIAFYIGVKMVIKRKKLRKFLNSLSAL